MVTRITDHDRRARLVNRHHLDRTAATVSQAVQGVIAMHSSDPSSPYLACRARVPRLTVADLERALFEDRTLWRLHAMRWTLFVVPVVDAPLLHAAAGMAVAEGERRRLEQWLAAEMDSSRVNDWINELETEVMAVLADGAEHRTRDLTSMVPGMKTEISVGSGKWTARVPVSSRILNLLAMHRRIVRTRPAGTWRSSQYRWALASAWFGTELESMAPETGRAGLLNRYLDAFGPATLVDIRWWTGWTVRQSAAALDALDAVTVGLEGGSDAFVLPGDLESPGLDAPTVALLPGLDSTPMGWKERSWYLGDRAGPLFDRNGNIGPTIWLDGRIVGGWGQHPDGEVVYRLLEDVGAEGGGRVEAEADGLTAWLAGVVVKPRFRTPLERELTSRA